MQLNNADWWVTCMNGLIWTKYKYSAFTSEFWVSLLCRHRLGQVEEIIIKLKHHVNLIPFEHLFKDGAFILIHWLNYVVNFRLFRPDIAKNERIVSNRECATYAFSGLNALLFDVFFLLKIFFLYVSHKWDWKLLPQENASNSRRIWAHKCPLVRR